MLNKIDKSLWYKVSCLSESNEDVECVVYANNINKMINYFEKMFNNFEIKRFNFINAVGLKIKPKDIAKLAKLNFVNYIASETKVFAQINMAKNVLNIDSLYFQGYTGKGVNVCIIDTGIHSHLDFLFPNNKIVYFKDFVNQKQDNYDDKAT